MRILVDTPEVLVRMVDEALGEERIALDVESDGLFAFRAGLCVVQIATTRDVFVVDTLKPWPREPLAKLLGDGGPIKVLHDLGFDARLLGEHGVNLGRCHDTAIAATLLGRKATGLGTLLATELGVTVDKSLQTHDWRTRPLSPTQLDYLAADVEHLLALDDRLRGEAETRAILEEVDEEIAYRLETAAESVREPDERPPYVRVKGIDKLAQVGPGGGGGGRRRDTELAIVRELAQLRETEARERDVPPYRVVANETLLALAAARPRTMLELSRMRGLGVEAGRLGPAILQAVARGVHAGKIPADEERWFERPRVPGEDARAERGRQAKLTAWRKAEAAAPRSGRAGGAAGAPACGRSRRQTRRRAPPGAGVAGAGARGMSPRRLEPATARRIVAGAAPASCRQQAKRGRQARPAAKRAPVPAVARMPDGTAAGGRRRAVRETRRRRRCWTGSSPPERAEAFGMGGAALAAAGLELVSDLRRSDGDGVRRGGAARRAGGRARSGTAGAGDRQAQAGARRCW